ncbi:ATP-binding protein [Streptomyces sp. NPDC056883]|uniref:ATP-binding protein n=1 Tax=Streptomyces sp. NPDC056883 TaxID=3345959 RepID=UPI0036A2B53F
MGSVSGCGLGARGGARQAARAFLAARPGVIEVAVEDPSPRMPRARTPDLVEGTGGFGWHMVNDLARHADVRPGPEGGKTVRAFLPR